MMMIKKDFKSKAPYFPSNGSYLINGYTSGMFRDVWHLLESGLNFTTLHFTNEAMAWGYAKKFHNGTKITTGLINQLFKKKIDVALAPTTLEPSTVDAVTFLPAMFDSVMVVAIPSTSVKERLDFTTFIKPFEFYLWIALFVAILINAICHSFFLEKAKYFVAKSCTYWWSSLKPFFGGSISIDSDNKISYKWLLIVHLISGYVIWIGYNSSLTSELVVVHKNYPFINLDTISSSSWR